MRRGLTWLNDVEMGPWMGMAGQQNAGEIKKSSPKLVSAPLWHYGTYQLECVSSQVSKLFLQIVHKQIRGTCLKSKSECHLKQCHLIIDSWLT